MIQAYAAKEPGGKLEPFEYDPGPLNSTHVEIGVDYCGICQHARQRMGHDDLSFCSWA